MKQEERLVTSSLVESGIGSENAVKGEKLKETEGRLFMVKVSTIYIIRKIG